MKRWKRYHTIAWYKMANPRLKVPSYYWRDFDGSIPKDALEAGDNVAIAQIVAKEHGILPGTYYNDLQVAFTEERGIIVNETWGFKILCTNEPSRFLWKVVNCDDLTGEILNESLVGGFQDGKVVYIGRVYHEDRWKIGKVHPLTNIYHGLRVWYMNGEQYHPDDFELLTYY